jgi:hypothetical protein
MYFKITSGVSLTATRTCTIAPNTVSRVMFIENATTGSQSITISQGSGANVTIAAGRTAVVYLDGAGSGAAVVDALALVDPGVTDTLAEVLVAGNTSGGTGLTMSSGDDLTLTGASYNVVWDSSADSLTFADNAKAVFGAGDDLQIYHDASDSIINDNGTGSLKLQQGGSTKLEVTATGIDVTGTVTADSAVFGTTSNSSTIVYLTSSTTGESELRLGDTDTDAGSIAYTNSDDTLTFRAAAAARMTLNSTGLDVTGTVTADGLTVDDAVSIDTSTGAAFSSTGNLKIDIDSDDSQTDRTFQITSDGNSKVLFQAEEGGDISFYEDTGTTAKFFWDASAESLGIGTSSPDNTLMVQGASTDGSASTGNVALFEGPSGTNGLKLFIDDAENAAGLQTIGNDDLLLNPHGGNVLVGKTATVNLGSDTTVGHTLYDIGVARHVASGSPSLQLTRTSSDGDIAVFTKDGTTVGSIGVDNNDNFYIGATTSGHSGFYLGNTNVAPMAAGTRVDNTIDLGTSTYGFKDLYLSGGVQLGAGNNISWGGAYGAGIPTISAGAGFFAFYPNGSTSGESMRLDASGDLLVGSSSSPQISAGSVARIEVIAESSSAVAFAPSLPASATGTSIRSQSVTAAGTGWNHFVGSSGNGSSLTTNNIFIYGNGDIGNTNNSYGAISDAKLKENITDATPKLAGINAVRIVNYNLIGHPEVKQLGVIAQELEQIFPGMVSEAPDRDMEGNDLGTVTKSVKYSVFVPMLIKAMQEQQATIEALTARIEALES